jgi:transcriptional regulator with XRE-family HTH domain
MRLREARERAELSQRSLGILAGLDPSVASTRVNQYERGVHEPSYATLEMFATHLGVPATYFFTSDDNLATLVKCYFEASPSLKAEMLKLCRTKAI